MFDTEERIRKTTLEKIINYSVFGGIFSVSCTLLLSIFTLDIFMFYSYFICIGGYAGFFLIKYFTFTKRKLKINTASILFIINGLFMVSFLMLFSGGYYGAMISILYALIIMSALLLEEKDANLSVVTIAAIYLFFFITQTLDIIKLPSMRNEVLRYGTFIIDFLSFYFVAFMAGIIIKKSKDSIRFYKLRSVRLSKIRKRLDFLVKRRTRQLKVSNEKLKDSEKKLKKSHRELKKTYKELQKLDTSKDEFISVAAHELKTPLTAIGGYAQLLKTKKISGRKTNQFLDVLDSESKRLSDMVSDMLDLSRIDLNVVRYNIEDVDVYEMFQKIRKQFWNKAKEKRLKFEFRAEKKLAKMVIDESKLYEILTNLVSNSIKYTKRGKIVVSAKRKSNNIEFSISDTGIGIPKRYQKKIFQRFFKMDNQMEKIESTGLGLSISKAYTEMLGGKIRLKSIVGKGTTFFVTLPIKTELKESRNIKFLNKK